MTPKPSLTHTQPARVNPHAPSVERGGVGIHTIEPIARCSQCGGWIYLGQGWSCGVCTP